MSLRVVIAVMVTMVLLPRAWADTAWESYKSRFMMADGRIVDTGNGNVSHTEGQGFAMLLAVAKKGRVIHTGNVLRGAPWQIVIFSLGMYLVVYGLRNAGLTDALSGVLNVLAENGLWVATLGTGVLTAVLSSLMNNMPTVLVGALSKNHPHRQPCDAALAACSGAKEQSHLLGLLFPYRDHHDPTGTAGDAGRTRFASLFFSVVRT